MSSKLAVDTVHRSLPFLHPRDPLLPLYLMDIAVSSQVRRSADAVLVVLPAALGARRACPEEHDDPAYPFASAMGRPSSGRLRSGLDLANFVFFQ